MSAKFRLMIVDDEVPFCRELGRMIEELSADFTVAGVAYDGEEALEHMRVWKPDVVFTDIRMQVMDGLQFLEQARKIDPELITVVISAFPDFHYAQKAMQLRTEDYLVKPVKEEQLHRLLKALLHKCLLLRERRETAVLQALLARKPVSAIPASMAFARYRLLLICAGAYCKTTTDSMHPGHVYWDMADRRPEIAALLPATSRMWLLDGLYENERLLLVADQGDDMPDARPSLSGQLFERLRHERIPLTVIAMPPVSDIRQLAGAMSAARFMLLKGAVFGGSVLIEEQEERSANPVDPHNDEREKRLANMIRTGDKEAFLHELKELLETGKQQQWKQHRVEHAIKRVADLFERQFAGDAAGRKTNRLDLETILSVSIGYEELLRSVSFQFAALFAGVGQGNVQTGFHGRLIADVERYLQEHFASPIMLQDLSEQFGLVPHYLSGLFRRNTGLTPGEYITKLRMEKAKQLIEEQPGVLLKQVAEAVGYQDPYYFSKVFKKATGLSPSQYMK